LLTKRRALLCWRLLTKLRALLTKRWTLLCWRLCYRRSLLRSRRSVGRPESCKSPGRNVVNLVIRRVSVEWQRVKGSQGESYHSELAGLA
jgi:hypothetical protein